MNNTSSQHRESVRVTMNGLSKEVETMAASVAGIERSIEEIESYLLSVSPNPLPGLIDFGGRPESALVQWHRKMLKKLKRLRAHRTGQLRKLRKQHQELSKAYFDLGRDEDQEMDDFYVRNLGQGVALAAWYQLAEQADYIARYHDMSVRMRAHRLAKFSPESYGLRGGSPSLHEEWLVDLLKRGVNL